jgi:hypothetical protein
MSNSVIDAQREFTDNFGELTIKHLICGVSLPCFSNERYEIDKFIADHQKPAPVKVPVKIRYTSYSVHYNN